jgi:hypothetical protein
MTSARVKSFIVMIVAAIAVKAVRAGESTRSVNRKNDIENIHEQLM